MRYARDGMGDAPNIKGITRSPLGAASGMSGHARKRMSHAPAIQGDARDPMGRAPIRMKGEPTGLRFAPNKMGDISRKGGFQAKNK